MRWIIGDIHGMLAPLQTLLAEVRSVDPNPRLYFVGDYVNRGPDSRRVIDLLLTLKDARFVRGNHDDIFDQILNNSCYARNSANGDRVVAFQWFMEHGLDDTFQSYGIDYAELDACRNRPSTERLDRIVAPVPQAHRDFIRNLPPVVEEGDIFIAHAKWDPYETDSLPNMFEQLKSNSGWRHKLLWGRYSEEELSRTKAWRRTGIFGHTPVYVYAASQTTGEVLMLPISGNKIVLLDTGAALSKDGRLTAYCADNQTFIQADHFGKLVEAQQRI